MYFHLKWWSQMRSGWYHLIEGAFMIFSPPSHSHWYKATIYQIDRNIRSQSSVHDAILNPSTWEKWLKIKIQPFYSPLNVLFSSSCWENHRPVYKYLTQIYNCLLKRECLVEDWMKHKTSFIIFLLQTRCGLSIYPLSFGDVHSPRTLHVCT